MMKAVYLHFLSYYNAFIKAMPFGRCCIAVGILLHSGYSQIIPLSHFSPYNWFVQADKQVPLNLSQFLL